MRPRADGLQLSLQQNQMSADGAESTGRECARAQAADAYFLWCIMPVRPTPYMTLIPLQGIADEATITHGKLRGAAFRDMRSSSRAKPSREAQSAVRLDPTRAPFNLEGSHDWTVRRRWEVHPTRTSKGGHSPAT